MERYLDDNGLLLLLNFLFLLLCFNFFFCYQKLFEKDKERKKWGDQYVFHLLIYYPNAFNSQG